MEASQQTPYNKARDRLISEYLLTLHNYLTLFPYQHRKNKFTIIFKSLALQWFLAASYSFISL